MARCSSVRSKRIACSFVQRNRGNASTRSARMLRWISLVPPSMELARARSIRCVHTESMARASTPSTSTASSVRAWLTVAHWILIIEPSGPGTPSRCVRDSPRYPLSRIASASTTSLPKRRRIAESFASPRARISSASSRSASLIPSADATPSPGRSNISVVSALRSRAHRREVTARVGLAEALAPNLVTREDRRQEATLLVLGAERDDHGPTHDQTEHVRRRRCACPHQLLVEDGLLHEGGA